MIDRELLEMAAKAAGIPVEWDGDGFVRPVPFKGFTNYEPWNPLADDGDALRLAIKCKIIIYTPGTEGDDASANNPYMDDCWVNVIVDSDPAQATRRAIVRAAAEIGKAMS